MKKGLLSILTILYMTVSSGMAMEIHYCMGERTGAGLYVSSNEKCGRCGMKAKKGGCCNDEIKFLKLSDAHKNVTNEHKFAAAPVAIADKTTVHEENISGQANIRKWITEYTPPGSPGLPLYITNRVFRI